jgi:hypothetical protein
VEKRKSLRTDRASNPGSPAHDLVTVLDHAGSHTTVLLLLLLKGKDVAVLLLALTGTRIPIPRPSSLWLYRLRYPGST